MGRIQHDYITTSDDVSTGKAIDPRYCRLWIIQNTFVLETVSNGRKHNEQV